MSGQSRKKPVKLTGERAWRTYLGGMLLDRFHGAAAGEDGHYPEEWIMSVVAARNTGREQMVEGLSRLADTPEVFFKDYIEQDPIERLGEEHVRRYGAHPGVLVKLIDSAERLAIQVHPDRQQARRLFESPYGKTECWYILGGRELGGEPPCIYIGFKEGITRDKWVKLFQQQDIQGMLDSLHRFEVQPGDTILIEGGVPHAIGAGCFLAEIQEPTDYTIRVERTTPSGFQIDDQMCHQGIGFEAMFDCFSFEGLSAEQVKERWFCLTELLYSEDGGKVFSLLDYKHTPYFCLKVLEVTDELTLSAAESFAGVYVLEGAGCFMTGEDEVDFTSGDQFFLAAGMESVKIRKCSDQAVELLRFMGPDTRI